MKRISAFILMLVFTAVFIEPVSLFAQKKNNVDIIYEQPTSFEDAKHRAKVFKEMEKSSPQKEDGAVLTGNPMLDSMVQLLQKLLGISPQGAGTINLRDPESQPQKESSSQQSSTFYQWKEIRKVEGEVR